MAAPKKAKPPADPAPEKKAAAKPKAAKPKPKAAKPAAKAAKPKPKGGAKKSTSSPDTYTDPKLRDRLKDEITAGDKGGKPGQWSARKAQLLAAEYEKAGGDYKNGEGKKTDAQQHLDSWTDEDWKTSDDKPAEREGGTTRYLPAEAWDQLSPAEKKATDAKKQAGSKRGKQFVANTDEARAARKSASRDDEGAGGDAAAKPKAKPKGKAKAKAEPEGKAESGAAKAKAKPKARKKSAT